MKTLKISNEQLTLFLCGDFNATPDHAVHKVIVKGGLTAEEKGIYFKEDPKGEKAVFSHSYKLVDSYGGCSEERPYTFKWGVKEDAIFTVLDFIYYTPGTLQIRAVRYPLKENEKILMVDKIGIPNENQPSDHLPVASMFYLK